MAKQVNYKILNRNGKGFICCGVLYPVDLGLTDKTPNSILLVTAKQLIESKFKNKVVDVTIEGKDDES
ncbi:hypothetical protein [Kamptonema sp. UHCC 0994]|uniref:hypothetical protein n=1 Tax=Kamptonema sp. UHCC 0994 TaxID=3031329 RepID=UPI0023BAE353|nr:hypothetical protein [Kamptonema sp. UHCC 0994]MDF0556453.1 hypothetical protein [Kamptonema sp. UHCC 0994]